MHGDSSSVVADVELAADEHSYGSFSLYMSKLHTSQRQSGSVTVEYEKDTLVDRVEMTEDSSVVEVDVELTANKHFSTSSSVPKSKSFTSQMQSEYTDNTVEDVIDTQVDRVELHEDSSWVEVYVKLAADQHSSSSSPL